MDFAIPELLICVFQYLAPRDLAAVSSVCKIWKDLANDNQLWKDLCLSAWGRTPTAHLDYKKWYIEKYATYMLYKPAIHVSLDDFFRALRQNSQQGGMTWQKSTQHVHDDLHYELFTCKYECPLTCRNIYALKVSALIQVPATVVSDIILDAGLQSYWDPSVVSVRVVTTLNRNTEMQLLYYQNMRMFCTRTVLDSSDGRTRYIISATTNEAHNLATGKEKRKFFLKKISPKVSPKGNNMEVESPHTGSASDSDNNSPFDSPNQPHDIIPQESGNGGSSGSSSDSGSDSDIEMTSATGSEQDELKLDEPGDFQDILHGLVKRGSGFAITGITSDSTELSYILQFEEGDWVDETSLQWMEETKWNIPFCIADCYQKAFLKKHEEFVVPVYNM